MFQMSEAAATREIMLERDAALAGDDGVTVVIPCFDQQEWLPESLGSVLAQTLPPREVFVIDDGSARPVAPEVARLTLDTTIPVRCVRVANRGLPGARNTGLMLARGHAFLPLDADDWIEPTFIERTLPLLDDGADVVCVGLQEHGERTGRYTPGCELGLEALTVDAERASNRLFYCSLFRTALLRECGGYNGRMINGYEDWDLWVDLMQRDARLVSVDEPLFNYRTRKGSMLAVTEAKWRDWNLDEMARHHGYERPASTTRRAMVLSRQQQRAAASAARRQAR